MSLSLPKKLLKQHLNRVFVETGTHMGNGVQLALDLGFSEVHSIEKNNGFYKICQARYHGNKKVYLHRGDSAEVLPKVLKIVKEPATFWLDAHIDPADKAKGELPLLKELKAIKNHDIKGHTILIDDRKQLGKYQDNFLKDAWVGVTEEDVLKMLAKININYNVYFEDNKFSKKQIIVATLTAKRRRFVV